MIQDLDLKIKLIEMGNTHPVEVGENIEKEDNHGLENWTFSRIELNWTSVGTGFALILGLILM